jgi:hypothetical protein
MSERIRVYRSEPYEGYRDMLPWSPERPWRCGPTPEDSRTSSHRTHAEAVRWATDAELRRRELEQEQRESGY